MFTFLVVLTRACSDEEAQNMMAMMMVLFERFGRTNEQMIEPTHRVFLLPF
jgi:hypothetical protein